MVQVETWEVLQKPHIDWVGDKNTNVTPQCRISGKVSDGGDPNTFGRKDS